MWFQRSIDLLLMQSKHFLLLLVQIKIIQLAKHKMTYCEAVTQNNVFAGVSADSDHWLKLTKGNFQLFCQRISFKYHRE